MINIRNIDLNLLRAFDILMDERNVSRAAERLSVTQPAVSGMLTRLRSSLNDPLFIRSQHGISPTPRALELAGPVKKILSEIEDILAPTTFDPKESTMKLSIAATDYALKVIVTPLIYALQEEAPNIRISIQPINDSQTFALMERGQLDLAITTPDSVHKELRAKTLFKEDYTCIMASGHPHAHKNTLTLDEFCSLKHGIVSFSGNTFHGVTDTVLNSMGRHRQVTISVPSFLSLIEILKNCELCAVIPKRLICGIDGLATITLPFEIPGFSKIMAWHERTHYSPAHIWIRERIYQLCDKRS
ncbi:LysR family transcriptional regulator [Microbulbifer epialgicus]|uniref:LysR family transcriptional regulator n=1 Tax=Microbulbifer epialgicus TaxID=393907 RepID=A0ABV4NW46_9GAMM